MSAQTDFLKARVSILSGLTDEELTYIASTITNKAVKKGGVVLFTGEAVPGLHVVYEGSVEIWVKGPKDKEAKKVADLGPGSFFGEASMLSESLAGATVKGSKEDGAVLFIIPQATFFQLIQARPEIQGQIEAVIASRRPGATKPQ
jgi:signal-transduction protein with cAMP-binding, CBS, and nucleotidyltransferase domain